MIGYHLFVLQFNLEIEESEILTVVRIFYWLMKWFKHYFIWNVKIDEGEKKTILIYEAMCPWLFALFYRGERLELKDRFAQDWGFDQPNFLYQVKADENVNTWQFSIHMSTEGYWSSINWWSYYNFLINGSGFTNRLINVYSPFQLLLIQ